MGPLCASQYATASATDISPMLPGLDATCPCVHAAALPPQAARPGPGQAADRSQLGGGWHGYVAPDSPTRGPQPASSHCPAWSLECVTAGHIYILTTGEHDGAGGEALLPELDMEEVHWHNERPRIAIQGKHHALALIMRPIKHHAKVWLPPYVSIGSDHLTGEVSPAVEASCLLAVQMVTLMADLYPHKYSFNFRGSGGCRYLTGRSATGALLGRSTWQSVTASYGCAPL